MSGHEHRLPDGLLEFVGRWVPPDPDTVPDSVRLHPATIDRIRTSPLILHPDLDPTAGRGAALFGLRIIPDPALPPGVWRVCTADGTLLRDSRSTNNPHRRPG